MAKLRVSGLSHGVTRVITGSMICAMGLVLASGVANAELPDSELSEDPNPQAMAQIMAMMSQEQVAVAALSADRIAELGGLGIFNAAPPASQMSSLSVFGITLGGMSEEDAASAAQVAEAQDSINGTALAPQSVNGFTMDVLDSMPSANGDKQWKCLTEALYFEARSESLTGQIAVGEVILNRVDSRYYPSSICGVVTQGASRLNACQFSYNCDGKAEHYTEPQAFARSGKLAKLLLEGRARVLTGGATHYHASWVNPSWASTLIKTADIGVHVFYRMP